MTDRNFQVGEVVDIIADFSGRHPDTVGLECTIMAPCGDYQSPKNGRVRGWLGEVVGREGTEYIFVPGELRRKRNPDDGRTVTTWDADVLGAPAPWQPATETVK